MTNLATLQKGASANDHVTGTITVGVTAVQFDSSLLQTYKDCLGVVLYHTVGVVYRGDSTVTTANGMPLVINVPNSIPLRDLTKLYLISSVAGTTVRYIIYT